MRDDAGLGGEAAILIEALPRGTLLHGRYRIKRVLGGGAAGVLFAAADEQAGQNVAVKVLHPTLVERREVLLRFRREAEVARRIRHPNLVAVLGFGASEEGLHYIVMELLQGEDLGRVLDRGVPPNRDQLAVDVLTAVLAALWVVHEAGIVHRDIKPANIFIWRTAEQQGIKILDFGLAQDFEDQGGLTMTGEILGTPIYMSPEQARGELVDARADLYSVSCVGYELLCGKPPILKGSPYLTMLAHVDEIPVRPSVLRPELPRSIDGLLMRGLEKEAGDRFLSASEMLEALCAAAPDLGVEHPPFDDLTRSVEVAVRALQQSWGLEPAPDETVVDFSADAIFKRAVGGKPGRDTVPAPSQVPALASSPAPSPVAVRAAPPTRGRVPVAIWWALAAIAGAGTAAWLLLR